MIKKKDLQRKNILEEGKSIILVYDDEFHSSSLWKMLKLKTNFLQRLGNYNLLSLVNGLNKYFPFT